MARKRDREDESQTPEAEPIQAPQNGTATGDQPSEKKPRREETPEEAGSPKAVVAGTKPFEDFDISPATVAALKKIGIVNLFPVQAESYAAIMTGTDVVVQAKTGSGKTLAFAIPTLEKIAKLPGDLSRGRGPAAVIFSPTRELAIQIKDVISSISRNYKVVCLYGGVAYATQERALHDGVRYRRRHPWPRDRLYGKGHLEIQSHRIRGPR